MLKLVQNDPFSNKQSILEYDYCCSFPVSYLVSYAVLVYQVPGITPGTVVTRTSITLHGIAVS